jgi:LacI family transcriptional regulator
MKQITQGDIARALNLSRVTVTKALKDHPDIAGETIKRVKTYAENHGYIPNLISRQLSSQKTFTIGFVVPKIFNSFCALAIEAAHETANKNGYQVIPMISYENPEIEKKAIQTLLSMRVDGIIIDVSEKTTELDIFYKVKQQKIPLIFIDRSVEKANFHRIVTNDFEIVRSAVNLAFSQGYRNMAFLSAAPQLNVGKQRTDGYMAGLIESGLNQDRVVIYEGEMSGDFGEKTLKKMHKQNKLPGLIICASLSAAIGIHKQAGKLGITIPDELGLITFGDNEISSLLTPSLAIFHVPIRKMAAKATDYIIKKCENNNYRIPKQTMYKSKLHIGNSIQLKK